MGKRKYLFFSGIVLFILFVVAGQLLWLFDPIKLDEFWISMLNSMIMLCSLVPLFWVLYAVSGLLASSKRKQGNQRLRTFFIILRSLLLISAIYSVYIILFESQLWLIIAISISITLLLGWIDHILSLHTVEGYKLHLKTFASFLGFIIIIALLLCPTGYLVVTPGLTMDMNQYAVVQADEKATSNGELMGVLIFDRPAFPIDWLYAQWFPLYEFSKRQKTDVPLTEQLQRVQHQKINANQLGSAIGFAKVGAGDGIVANGVRVIGLVEDSPALEKLQINDVIVEMEGKQVNHVNHLIDYLSEISVGEKVELIIRRQQELIQIDTLTYASETDPGRAILGIHITTDIELDIPYSVNFHSYILHVGGPSHGAMLALTIVDQMTPDGITNGNRVAGTGTIQANGSVGPIGGIEQKAYTVERAGADVFFVPKNQLEQARQGSESLNIVGVNNLDDMIKWLADNPK